MTFNEIKTKANQDKEFRNTLLETKKKGWRMFSGYLVTPKTPK